MKIIKDEKIIDEILTRGVENIYPDKTSLKKLLMSGKKIRLYCGYDPNSPSLHLGHGITVRKLAKFMALGHEVIFLFGDFTAQIGDPTDKTATRWQLTHQQVLNNLRGWKKQIKNIIDIRRVRFEFNAKWLGKLDLADFLRLSSNFTAQQLISREMFKIRMAEGKDLYFHELIYPILQAYDSVALDVDLEIGGNDQMFNMLAGRDLMKKVKNKEKFVLTAKLLEDPSGKKMGKSEGNMVALSDSAEDMYGKIMSWTDGMIIPGLEILTDIPLDLVEKMAEEIKDGSLNPRDAKMALAKEVVTIYHGHRAAQGAEENFKQIFQRGQKPLQIVEVKIADDKNGEIGVLDLFVKAGLARSNNEVRRLIQEGAIYIDDGKVEQDGMTVKIPAGGLLLQRGKKQFARAMRR